MIEPCRAMDIRSRGLLLLLLPLMFADAADKAKYWPDCIFNGKALRSAKPVLTDVRPWINHPDSVRHRTVTYSSKGVVGMYLRDDPHDLGEMVLDVKEGSQAAGAGVAKGWIITEVDGRTFSSTERLKDVADDFAKAKTEGATLTVKYDVRTYLDCTNANCAKSGRFPTASREACAEACEGVPGCEWWTFAKTDDDSMCYLQEGASLTKSEASSSAPRECVPLTAVTSTQGSYPTCVNKNAHISAEGGSAFADVKKFITRSDEVRHRIIDFTTDTEAGMVLKEVAHEYGEVVEDVVDGSQAQKAGVRKGWIITLVDGKPFKKSEGLQDIAQDFMSARNNKSTFLVKFDVKTSIDCTNADCSKSDKLPVPSEAACATVCSQVPDCQWWTYGPEEEDTMCWLRTSSKGLKAREGFSAGKRACSPGRSWTFWFLLIVSLIVVGAVLAKGGMAENFIVRFLALFQRCMTKRAGAPWLTELAGFKGKKANDDWDFDDDNDAEESHSLIGRRR